MNQIDASRTNAADRQLQQARMNEAGDFVTLHGCFSEVQGFIVPAHWVLRGQAVMVRSVNCGGGS